MAFSLQGDHTFDVQHFPLDQPTFLDGNSPLKEAIALMMGQEKGSPQSCLIITTGEQMVGILTERDLVRLSLSLKSVNQTLVRDIMTCPVVTIEQQNFTDIFSAYSLMRRHRIRHLPVVNGQQQVIGVITLSLLRQALHLGYFLRFREVQEIMTTQVITIAEDAPVLSVAQLMARHRISCVVVVQEVDNLVIPIGIVTERDIVQLQGLEKDLSTVPTKEVMSHPVIQLNPEDSLAIAQEIMKRHRVRRIVVTGKQGELEGILTETNLSQILDPLELFGMLEILQHRVKQLIQDRDRLLPKENLHLQQALENGEFLLYYQPQLDTRSQQIIGAEVLVRWRSPERGMVSPSEFIPLAEMTGFIVPLGEWILKEACLQTMRWQAMGLPPIQISVNLSSHQLSSPNFVPRLKTILTETRIDPRWLKLELTESSLVENIDHTLAQFHGIKKLGVAIAIDDFGTGYASLGYLQHFPFDTLKIDRCFVENIHQNPKNAAITTAIINMAEQLNFSVVAEGVESAAELEFLRQRHCHTFQGYLISRPLAADVFTEFLQQHLHQYLSPISSP